MTSLNDSGGVIIVTFDVDIQGGSSSLVENEILFTLDDWNKNWSYR